MSQGRDDDVVVQASQLSRPLLDQRDFPVEEVTAP